MTNHTQRERQTKPATATWFAIRLYCCYIIEVVNYLFRSFFVFERDSCSTENVLPGKYLTSFNTTTTTKNATNMHSLTEVVPSDIICML